MEDPKMTAWRIEYVTRYNEENRSVKAQQAQKLENAKKSVHDYLKTASFDRQIKIYLSSIGYKYSQTKSEKGQLPLDGLLNCRHKPAYVLDHYGQTTFSGKQRETPGIKYTFRSGLDEFVLVVTICASDSGRIFPFFFLTHEDGRLHQVDWQTQYTSPTEDQLERWLKNNLRKKHNSP